MERTTSIHRLVTGGESLTASVRRAATPLGGGATDHDELLAFVGDARIVLLGEASHGTDEFYRERARITQRLIEEKGFIAVAIEGDWPDAYPVNRFVPRRRCVRDRGAGRLRAPSDLDGGAMPTSSSSSTGNALQRRRVRFSGLGSMEAVLRYLEKTASSAIVRLPTMGRSSDLSESPSG